MQHQLPHLSLPGGCCVAPRLAAVAAVAAVAPLVVVFAMTLAAPSQSWRPVPSQKVPFLRLSFGLLVGSSVPAAMRPGEATIPTLAMMLPVVVRRIVSGQFHILSGP